MNLSKKSFALFLVLAFVTGYGLNFLVGSIGIEHNQTGSDISKVSRYNRIRSDVQLDLLQEKLRNDDGYLNQTKEMTSFLLSRVNTLADLTERSVKQCSGIEELSAQVAGLQSLNVKAGNTGLALEGICNGLERMAQGKNATNFEQSYNNSVAGFFRIERQMELGKSFVEAAGKYLESNENAELAALVSDWTVYGYQNAKLNKSVNDMAYWDDKFKKMAGDATDGPGLESLSALDASSGASDELLSNSLIDMLQVLHLDFDENPNNSNSGNVNPTPRRPPVYPGINPPNPTPYKRDTLIW